MKPLYKQILSDRESASFILEKFETDQEVLDAVKSFYEYLKENVLDNKNEISLVKLICDLNTYQLDQIYISNDKSLNDISSYLFGDWDMIKSAIEDAYDKEHAIEKKKKHPEKYLEMKEKALKKQTVYSIEYLNTVLEDYLEEKCSIETYFTDQIMERCSVIQDIYAECSCLYGEYPQEQKLCQDKKNTNQIKKLLDAIKNLQQLMKPLEKGSSESIKDELFYVEFIRNDDAVNQINSLYNKVRNYVTQKPYSLEKVKLNFAKSTLLAGWDRNKEKDNLGVILIREGNYYLGIMNRKSNQVIEKAPIAVTKQVYQKMEYKLLPNPSKMLPKVFFSKSRIEEFAPDQELIKHYKEGTHKKGEKFSLEDCHRLIDFFKKSIEKHEEWREFHFQFSDTENYKDISEFYREVERQGYKITFKDIDESYINELVDNGQLYLFWIYNKDFSPYSKGMPNLHTLYWKMLFSPENLQHPSYRLNGGAEVFYRKASIKKEDIISHEAGVNLENKYPLAPKKESQFKHDLIKDNRFTVDKFQFHVPITMNTMSQNENYLNHNVRKLIHNNKNMHVIGIDRGERNLLYISVIDMAGNIIEQKSLNTIIMKNREEEIYEKDYQKILLKREAKNDDARKNWKEIGGIKELKEGYLSQVIHVIAQMMIQYDAIVVLEDLSPGFKRSRQKVERQVYQKFEKMLIDKLNFLVDKNKNFNEVGGLLQAYQLTEKFKSFQKLGKQSGFLFYVPAWNTSKIDPTTGFANLLNARYVNKNKAQRFIKKFESISYSHKWNCFEFYFDYSNFTERAAGSQEKWCICSEGKRLEGYRNPEKNMSYDVRDCDLTKAFIDLFEEYHIEWEEGNLIEGLIKVDATEFYRNFMHLMSLTLKMRNSRPNTEEDWLISPVRNRSGKCFNTENVENEAQENKQYPCDPDANGAYNIARKGLWIVEQLQKTPEDKLDKVKLAMSNKEWLAYAQEHKI
jgi:CRISPR-associated protein Cpf1